MGRRKKAIPEEGRGRRGVRDMLRLCKGSISHSEAGVLREDGEACPLSEENVDGIYNDWQRPDPAVIEPRPLRLEVAGVDEQESQESRF
jgi:hypothetical protein